MSKTIMSSMMLALAGIFALNLRAAPAWTTEDVAPEDWTALSGNLLAGLTGTKTGTISTGYGTTDMGVLTDGVAPTVNGNESRVAFQNTGAVEWSFTTPKTLEQVRVSGCYLGGSTYTRISISAVYVKLFGSDTWTELDGSSFLDNSGRSQNVVICASLADPATGYLAQGVAGLKVAFGANVPLASYIVEIEAVGSTEATGPVLGFFAVAPAKTKATVSGTIADVGTDATTCDVYLALDGGAATKIAEDVTGVFEYLVQGLTAGTTYSYELSVSNNAPTSRGKVQSGDFTTLASDASTMLWTSEDIAPDDWVALADNALAGNVGVKTAGAIAGTNYATDDSSVLTDGAVPKTGGAAYIYGFQNGCTMEWTLDNAITLESLRLSAAYLAGTAYSKLAVGSVSVKTAGSDEWAPLDAPAFSDIVGRSSGVLICATLSEIETGVLAENVAGIKIVFGNVNALGSYVGEIEAVGRTNTKRGMIIIAR